jgi:folate-binding protein YgfZ
MDDKLDNPPGGFVCPLAFGLIEVKGPDAARFLQARTTNDVLALQNGCGQQSCLLDRKAHVEAIFSLHRLNDSYWVVAESGQISIIVEQLERFVFNEKVELVDWTGKGRFAFVAGLAGRKLLLSATAGSQLPPLHPLDVAAVELWGLPGLLFKKTVTGHDGFFVWWEAAKSQALEENLQKTAAEIGLAELPYNYLESARVESGLLRGGLDVTNDNLLPETGLEEEAVSYTKGCYLGQEVIARIKTFGAPRRGICGLVFEPGFESQLPADAVVTTGGKEIGRLKSSAFSTNLDRVIAFAYLMKEYRVPGGKLTVTIDDAEHEVTVSLLPFTKPQSGEEESRRLYEMALTAFTTDEMKAIELLQDALVWNPVNADGYEMLGVILSRHDRIDEAIALMKKLEELDPNSVMAHANLSVFYMQKGDKEAAEEEKALAMSIRMQQLAREVDEKKSEEVAEKQKQEEALARMEMFKQVLEIDPEDLLANCGLGSIHVELSQYDKAIPLLEKAIEIKPTHSVAYLALGAAYSGAGERERACDVYKRGIEVASKRGDMTPLKEMQAGLHRLEQSMPS